MKSKRKDCRINIYVLDDNRQVVHGGGLSDIKIKEAYILEKSTELYQNSAPCIIIRTKIMNRVYEDLRIFIKDKMNDKKQQVFSVHDLPEEFKQAIDLEAGKYVMAEIA